jgi:hypothetical protein
VRVGLLLAVLAATLAAVPAGHAAGPLETALIDNGELDGPDAALAVQRARAAGTRAFRLMLEWYKVAPAERPDGFDAANPADPAYHWEDFDRKIRLLASAGLQPIVVFHWPPLWAGGGATPTPDQVEFGKFARAAATRYSGSFQGLPRVRYWMIWNEPNIELDFSPQFDDADRPVSPANYRHMVNIAADALHAVHADNLVIVGALSPFGVDVRNEHRAIAPLRFMREFLCMSAGRPPQPTCDEQARFDVWSHHPYTRGGPTHSADNPDDVSLGDLTEMSQLLAAAVRAGHVVSRRPVRFWATEFSWDTSPPDPNAVPLRLQARWVSEALYRMWKGGIGLVAWLEIRDAPYPDNAVQAGLWFRGGPRMVCDEPKTPTLSSFRFPFVAYSQGKRFSVWGRTPAGRRSRVVIERATPRGWRALRTVATDAYGIFSAKLLRQPARGRFYEMSPVPRDYYHAALCDGPRSYWRFGERALGLAANETGGVAGTYLGGVSFAEPGAVGGANTAITLDGSGRVALGWEPSPRTVEAWVKTTEGQEAAIFSNRNELSHFVYLGVTPGGRILSFDSGALRSETRVADGRWHHVVYTYDGTTGRLYIDGALDGSMAHERMEGAAEASAGYDAALKRYFRGSIDDIALYDYPLTEGQIKEHLAARKPRPAKRQTFRGAYLRARLSRGSVASQPFSLARFRDCLVDPFGHPALPRSCR